MSESYNSLQETNKLERFVERSSFTPEIYNNFWLFFGNNFNSEAYINKAQESGWYERFTQEFGQENIDLIAVPLVEVLVKVDALMKESNFDAKVVVESQDLIWDVLDQSIDKLYEAYVVAYRNIDEKDLAFYGKKYINDILFG